MSEGANFVPYLDKLGKGDTIRANPPKDTPKREAVWEQEEKDRHDKSRPLRLLRACAR